MFDSFEAVGVELTEDPMGDFLNLSLDEDLVDTVLTVFIHTVV